MFPLLSSGLISWRINVSKHPREDVFCSNLSVSMFVFSETFVQETERKRKCQKQTDPRLSLVLPKIYNQLL